MAQISTTGHSALVNITLRVGAETFAVSQLGPDFLILKEATALPPCAGIVTLEIDGQPDESSVRLPEGIVPGRRRVVIEEVMPELAAVA